MDADNIDGHAEQARHFHIDPRYSYEPNAAPDCWSCIDDRTYDGAPDGSNMIGWGKTQEEALADLVRLFEERADYWQSKHEAEAERRAQAPFSDAEIERCQPNYERLFGFKNEDPDCSD